MVKKYKKILFLLFAILGGGNLFYYAFAESLRQSMELDIITAYKEFLELEIKEKGINIQYIKFERDFRLHIYYSARNDVPPGDIVNIIYKAKKLSNILAKHAFTIKIFYKEDVGATDEYLTFLLPGTKGDNGCRPDYYSWCFLYKLMPLK